MRRPLAAAVAISALVVVGRPAESAADLGYLYQRGEGVAQDAEMARRLYKQGCDGGYAQACKMLSPG